MFVFFVCEFKQVLLRALIIRELVAWVGRVSSVEAIKTIFNLGDYVMEKYTVSRLPSNRHYPRVQ